jgi:hypothetical protein
MFSLVKNGFLQFSTLVIVNVLTSTNYEVVNGQKKSLLQFSFDEGISGVRM